MKKTLAAALLAALTLAVVPTVFAQMAAPAKGKADQEKRLNEEAKAKQAERHAQEEMKRKEAEKARPKSEVYKPMSEATKPIDAGRPVE
jgi:hypothetical protein